MKSKKTPAGIEQAMIVELSSEEIFEAVSDGIRNAGANVTDISLVSDCSNGAAACRYGQLLSDLPIEHHIINAVPDGRFPEHGPNPLEAENLQQARDKIVAERADIGVCFNGDGDRIVFIDEQGRPVPADLITGLLGLHFFKHRVSKLRGCRKVLYDVRSSRSVKEFLNELGAEPVPCPVGHAVVKAMLRRERGLYAGELTGTTFPGTFTTATQQSSAY